jgi:hypothetical protein
MQTMQKVFSLLVPAMFFLSGFRPSVQAADIHQLLAEQFGCCRKLIAAGTFLERDLDFSLERVTDKQEEKVTVEFTNPKNLYYRRRYQLRLNLASGFPEQQYIFVPRADEYRIRRVSLLPMEVIEGTPLPYFFLTPGYLLHDYEWHQGNAVWHGVPKEKYNSIRLPVVNLMFETSKENRKRLKRITAGAYTLLFRYRYRFEIVSVEIEKKDGEKETIKINSWEESVSLP